MKKQSCRMTQQERDNHKEAGKLRRMTDQQLIDEIRGLKEKAEKAEAEAKAMAAAATDAEHEAEIARRDASTAAEAMKKKVEELSGKEKKGGKIEGREAVEVFLDKLLQFAGTGNGIGRGTIFKLRKALEGIPDADFERSPEE